MTRRIVKGRQSKRGKIAKKDKTDNDGRLKQERELQLQRLLDSNIERDNRHRQRNMKQLEKERQVEVEYRQQRVASGLPEDDDAACSQSYRIRQTVINDIENPYAWWEKYGKAYEGSDHFQVKQY